MGHRFVLNLKKCFGDGLCPWSQWCPLGKNDVPLWGNMCAHLGKTLCQFGGMLFPLGTSVCPVRLKVGSAKEFCVPIWKTCVPIWKTAVPIKKESVPIWQKSQCPFGKNHSAHLANKQQFENKTQMGTLNGHCENHCGHRKWAHRLSGCKWRQLRPKSYWF